MRISWKNTRSGVRLRSKRYRNALVRANYTNLQKGIHETTEYLETFLRDWLLNEKNELYNRNLHISGLLIEEKVDIGDTKVDIKNEKVDIQDKKWILKAAGRPADFLISYAALRKSWPAEKDKPPRERSSRDIAPCNTVWVFLYFLRRPAGDDLSARFAAARSHVDDIVRIFDYI